ncbi:LacI family DNA-binding transcriptional regulator [Curtobacterium flaccumfaciens pv. flaccumfaciens]|jgi:LacI family transcriptional regulator|uniref:LacI family DNA-binding transcriptional regulator n=1 Tax=Curtobacterium TaxID=2034 RepID=UPI000DAA012F|nr:MULTISPECIES: LacI family DNA-binding transcriptional regulator [Curtobacterium]MBO9047559.1 LacI family DNA-binding transcriptional regulator [Curtobacterium flaccumfaciens pv. flaccumfaciens]MBO9056962.1 LacI family DNA-binding transcriptional regulator [Curtobacterium flaccumfaciens pv. flaccumfaciens]MBT1666662.1 LacI family transcriptional regulator [Curtobacterium flaccumfaciens pv. flaccumfaciens]MCS6581039.1 LacI family transcriptional regulator [Curtobacterium flaccumfaciens pv. bet
MAVSVREVAALAGVSLGTVSNVLNRPDKVAPGTVERVQSAIATLGFVRNDSARQLRAGRSSTVGLIVLDGGNPFFTDVARGAEDAAMDNGLAVLIGNSDESTDRERTYVDLFEERRVAGLLISPAGDDLSRLARLRDQGTAVVLVDRRADDEHFASVSVDDVAGGRIAVEHLAAIGRTHIAFVGGPFGIRQVADRHAGALAAAQAAGIRLEALPTTSLSVLEGRRIGEAIQARPAAERPDAVFAANDLLAVGLEQAFIMRGTIAVPEQIAIVGYDDIAFAESAVVPLTSVRQPAQDLGRRAIELLTKQVEQGQDIDLEHVEFTPELVVRQSSVADA